MTEENGRQEDKNDQKYTELARVYVLRDRKGEICV